MLCIWKLTELFVEQVILVDSKKKAVAIKESVSREVQQLLLQNAKSGERD